MHGPSEMGAGPPPFGAPPAPPPRRRGGFGLLALLLLCAGLGLGYYAWDLRRKHDAAILRLNEALAAGRRCMTAEQQQKVELDRCETDRARERAGREGAGQRLAAVESTLSASQAELEELRQNRAEVERRLRAFKQIADRFRKMIDTGKLQVVMRRGQMIVQLPSSVLFPSGSADLSDDGKAALKQVAAILRQFPRRRFMVAGHTDNVPITASRFKSNRELSTARALTVTEFLVASRMRPQNLVAAGYGEHEPVKSNRTEAGRQENRRIEIVLLPRLPELPAPPGLPGAAAATAGGAR